MIRTVRISSAGMAREMILFLMMIHGRKCTKKKKIILLDIFGNMIIDIQQFGSTSIKGLNAKPIIDIMIIVDAIAQVDVYSNAKHAYIIRIMDKAKSYYKNK